MSIRFHADNDLKRIIVDATLCREPRASSFQTGSSTRLDALILIWADDFHDFWCLMGEIYEEISPLCRPLLSVLPIAHHRLKGPAMLWIVTDDPAS